MSELAVTLSVALIVACVLAYRWILKRGNDNFWKLMRETNQRYRTSFGTTKDESHTVLGANSLNGIIAFDQSNRKLAYITKSGKSVEIFDFSYIKSWKITWLENTVAHAGPSLIGTHVNVKTSFSNVKFEIGTNDLKRPLIKISVPSRAYADQWNERLNILLN